MVNLAALRGCTCVLREYLAVPQESTGVEEISHALNIVLAENVSPKDTQDTNVHSKYSKYRQIQIKIQIQ